jgi:hypothetical protein
MGQKYDLKSSSVEIPGESEISNINFQNKTSQRALRPFNLINTFRHDILFPLASLLAIVIALSKTHRWSNNNGGVS